jgi:hypothetical protein
MILWVGVNVSGDERAVFVFENELQDGDSMFFRAT